MGKGALASCLESLSACLKHRIRRHGEGDLLQYHQPESLARDVDSEEVLVPVYIGAFTLRGQSWRVLVNGSTGQVVGKIPRSRIKITLVVAAVSTFLEQARKLHMPRKLASRMFSTKIERIASDR